MEGVCQVAALLLALGGAAEPASPMRHALPPASQTIAPPSQAMAAKKQPMSSESQTVTYRMPALDTVGRAQSPTPVVQMPADSWLGEDKFRHFAASWAAMVFTYSAARAVDDDHNTAVAIALPVTAAFGIAKEVVDHRRGGPFSFRDLTADALGAGAAWLFLREVR